MCLCMALASLSVYTVPLLLKKSGRSFITDFAADSGNYEATGCIDLLCGTIGSERIYTDALLTLWLNNDAW